jgi:hypothetical protein
MSPVKDNLERWDFEAIEKSPHSNFLKIKN